MTSFYDNKFYNRKGQDRRFYIPLRGIKVDVDRLASEIQRVIKPSRFGDFGITTSMKYIDEEPCNFDRYSGISTEDEFGERILATGERDYDIVHWPSVLKNSYMKQLSDEFSELIGITNPRARMSVSSSVEYHNDPHTPYRIHIAIKADPESVWKFREPNGAEHTIFQPADGTPVLIETGCTMHSVYRPRNKYSRMHLWYQFHDIISDEVLSKF